MIFLGKGCLLPPEVWEDVESDYDHVLNVFSVISLDPKLDSFVGLYRTTDLDELSQIFVGVDTVMYIEGEEGEDGWWWIDSIYEPAALIKNAIIHVKDDQDNIFNFTFIETEEFFDTTSLDTLGWHFEWIDTFNVRMNYYKDTTGTFDPQPNKAYYLSINTLNYDPVIGELTTPNYPVLIDSMIQDTVSPTEPYEIHWEYQENAQGLLTGEILFDNLFSLTVGRWCGDKFERAVDLSDSTYTVPGEFCDDTGDSLAPEDFFIRLTSMDKNYYEYFITGEVEEYSNLFLNNPTTKGRSIGIEGGFGVFGSIASDGIIRVIVPE